VAVGTAGEKKGSGPWQRVESTFEETQPPPSQCVGQSRNWQSIAVWPFHERTKDVDHRAAACWYWSIRQHSAPIGHNAWFCVNTAQSSTVGETGSKSLGQRCHPWGTSTGGLQHPFLHHQAQGPLHPAGHMALELFSLLLWHCHFNFALLYILDLYSLRSFHYFFLIINEHCWKDPDNLDFHCQQLLPCNCCFPDDK